MEKMDLQRQLDKVREDSLENHARLSRLFREDRLAFEREKKEMIDDFFSRIEDEQERERLKALQDHWDRVMRRAGSKHNRFVLAQTLFWKNFYENWLPMVDRFKSV
jgi:hypothetical protein